MNCLCNCADALTARQLGELLNKDYRPALRKTDLHRRDLDEAIEMKKAQFVRTINVLQSVRRYHRKSSAPGKTYINLFIASNWFPFHP